MITLDYKEQIRIIKNLYYLSNEFWNIGDDTRGALLSEAVGLLLQQLIVEFDIDEIINDALNREIFAGYAPIIKVLDQCIQEPK